ncbi:MAG: type II toxin-antitoxin system RelE/ParE family toxin [Sphingobacteriaceae bacterium]|nr:type II toxin-antitoxin system RelE/ParE family toxin [Sphingobacteriaceae bacterium]
MGLVIFWTNFAKNELKNIYKYHQKFASTSIAKKLVSELAIQTKSLFNLPEIGQIEVLLKSKPQKFRYLIHKNYKIIYWTNIKKNRIEIVNIFDCRQNPIKITRNK